MTELICATKRSKNDRCSNNLFWIILVLFVFKIKPNMTSLNRGKSDVILGFYLSFLRDGIFRIYERIKSNNYYSPNLMNLSRVSNPPKNRFQLSAGINLETLNTILSGTNHIGAAV